MDFLNLQLNFNSVVIDNVAMLPSIETLPGFDARAAFTVNSASVFKEDVDIVPTIVDDTLSYVPWGGDNLQLIDRMGDNQMPFFYLNCFGMVEQLSLQRTTTEKGKSDRSIATLGKTSCFYDVTTSKEYEVESAALTSDECLQVEQMLTSPSVRIPYGANVAFYGATSSCFPPASAVRFAIAASSKSMTSMFSYRSQLLNKC